MRKKKERSRPKKLINRRRSIFFNSIVHLFTNITNSVLFQFLIKIFLQKFKRKISYSIFKIWNILCFLYTQNIKQKKYRLDDDVFFTRYKTGMESECGNYVYDGKLNIYLLHLKFFLDKGYFVYIWKWK